MWIWRNPYFLFSTVQINLLFYKTIYPHWSQSCSVSTRLPAYMCSGYMCVCVSLCFSNYTPPPTPPSQISARFFFCPQIPFYLCSSSLLQSVLIRASSPTIPCICVTTHITAGACLCLVRGLQFPYITLQIPYLSDFFGLHVPCFFFFLSLDLWIKEFAWPSRAEIVHHTLSELAGVQALSQMSDHRPNYAPRAWGRVCVRVCVRSLICGGYKRLGQNKNDLVFIAFKDTRTS